MDPLAIRTDHPVTLIGTLGRVRLTHQPNTKSYGTAVPTLRAALTIATPFRGRNRKTRELEEREVEVLLEVVNYDQAATEAHDTLMERARQCGQADPNGLLVIAHGALYAEAGEQKGPVVKLTDVRFEFTGIPIPGPLDQGDDEEAIW